jgi:hypothetical protein
MPENPKKTQYILNGRSLASQTVNVLKQCQDYDAEYNKLGFIAAGADPITQEDIDFAMQRTFPGGPAGTLTLADWQAGIYSLSKNGNDYAAGEDISLLKIAS